MDGDGSGQELIFDPNWTYSFCAERINSNSSLLGDTEFNWLTRKSVIIKQNAKMFHWMLLNGYYKEGKHNICKSVCDKIKEFTPSDADPEAVENLFQYVRKVLGPLGYTDKSHSPSVITLAERTLIANDLKSGKDSFVYADENKVRMLPTSEISKAINALSDEDRERKFRSRECRRTLEKVLEERGIDPSNLKTEKEDVTDTEEQEEEDDTGLPPKEYWGESDQYLATLRMTEKAQIFLDKCKIINEMSYVFKPQTKEIDKEITTMINLFVDNFMDRLIYFMSTWTDKKWRATYKDWFYRCLSEYFDTPQTRKALNAQLTGEFYYKSNTDGTYVIVPIVGKISNEHTKEKIPEMMNDFAQTQLFSWLFDGFDALKKKPIIIHGGNEKENGEVKKAYEKYTGQNLQSSNDAMADRKEKEIQVKTGQ